MKRVMVIGAVCWALLSGAALAAQQVTLVAVTEAWSRPVSNTQIPAVVYMTVTASGDNRLTGVSTPVAAQAGLHQSQERGGVTAMRAVEGMDLPSGQPVTLGPAGYHVMLMGLTRPLVAGQQFPLTLDLAQGGAVTITVTVRPMGPGSPPQGGHHQH